MQPGEASSRELSCTANFVYTTVPKVYTALLFETLIIFQILGFFHKLADFGPIQHLAS
jgi:hypothetical protein